MIRTFLTSVALAALLLSPMPSVRARVVQSIVSSDEATLKLKDTGGHARSLIDHRGRIVVLNFWATWCKPCREEIPILVSLDSRYRERGVDFISASADDSSAQKNVAGFARRLKISFPVWVGATMEDIKRIGLGDAIPATVIIDRNGVVVGRILGPVSNADLQNRIEWLLGDRQTPAPAAVVYTMDQVKHDQQQEEQSANNANPR
jgi:thiol-disulfide isomerase/thioredoxin